MIAGRDDLISSYLDALELELAQQVGSRKPVNTLFLGGGTPSHLPPDALERLFQILDQWFELTSNYEFSIEVNPAGLTAEKMDLFKEAGINRISLGIQSFNNTLLKTLERDHTLSEIQRVIPELQQRFENISFDLIFGIPGETFEDWKTTIKLALELRPQHLSTYGLTFEKGTSFWKRREKGTLRQQSEEQERVLYEHAMHRLPDEGYRQYEISNFARPGFECRHNQIYWNGYSYYGLGPGAARYLKGVRSLNHRSVTTWLNRVLSGQSGNGDSENLSPEDKARELAIIQLRTRRGIPLQEFHQRTGFELKTLAGDVIREQTAMGFLTEEEGCLRLTEEGRYVADTLVVEFL